MKKIFSFLLCWRFKRHFVALCATQLLTSSLLLQAQAPQGIPYQAIARNASGVAIANTAVKVRFSIRDSIATGAIKYQETHNTTTSALGLFSVNVGMGTVVNGTFSGINWGKNAKFLQVELEPAGGSSYTDLGTTQMMSVPYALYAGSVSNFESSGNIKFTSRIGFSYSGTWTCPLGVNKVQVELWSGGGGGGGSNQVSFSCNGSGCTGILYRYNCNENRMYGLPGANGGNGGYIKRILDVIPGHTYSIMVGQAGTGGLAGGEGGSPFGKNGTDGGTTAFDTLINVVGGKAGNGAYVVSGCPGRSESNNGCINFTCNGFTIPLAGENSVIDGYNYSSNPSIPSYVPNSYVNLFPGSKASGGGGSGAVSGSPSINSGGGYIGGNGYYVYNGGRGGDGESGYCVISY